MIQKQIFYLHKLPIWWRQKLDVPESFGFMPGQVLPLHITTSDSCRLFAWLIVPLGLWAVHEDVLTPSSSDSRNEILSLLRKPDSLLVIYFHGNAGTVAQTRRTDAYRMVSSGQSQRIFVLTFDYRGFGRSTGSPSETGLIEDAISVISWAMDIGSVSPGRIVLLGQSLGTAVVTAALEVLVRKDPAISFAGIILCAAFVDATSAILSYKIGGLVAPFAYFSGWMRKWFDSFVLDKWDTRGRLARLSEFPTPLRITLLAATSDKVIPYTHTKILFDMAHRCSTGVAGADIDDRGLISEYFGRGGTVRSVAPGEGFLREVLVKYGGHNGIMKWAPVTVEVLKCFGL